MSFYNMDKNIAFKKIHVINSLWTEILSKANPDDNRYGIVLYPPKAIHLTVAEDETEAEANYNDGYSFDFSEHPADEPIALHPFNTDDSDRGIFCKCLSGDESSDTLDAAAAVDAGGGLVTIAITNHSISAGDPVRIDGSVAYDGDYIVESVVALTSITFKKTYVAETFTGAENIYTGILVNAEVSQ